MTDKNVRTTWIQEYTLGDGEKGVGAGVPGTELLAIPSSPPSTKKDIKKIPQFS